MPSQLMEIQESTDRQPTQVSPPRYLELRFRRSLKGKTVAYRGYVKREGAALSGVIVSGRDVYFGTGAVKRDSKGERWELATSATGKVAQTFLNLSISPDSKRGAFIQARGKNVQGGLMGGILCQEQGGVKEDKCGKLLWDNYFESSDENGQHKIYYHWWHYEKCDKIQFVDISGAGDPPDPDKMKPVGSVRELKTDPKGGKPFTPKKAGGVTITPLSTPLNGEDVGPGEKRAGQYRAFYFTGCKNPRVVQFVKNTRTYSPPKGNAGAKLPADTKGTWGQDAGDPYPGQMDVPGGATASTDIPANDPAGLANDKDIQSCPDGTTVTQKWEFETFFFCDGVFIGWIGWDMSVTYTITGGKPTPGAPSISESEFHEPDVKSQSGGPK